MNIKESIESVRTLFRTDSDPFPTDYQTVEALRIKYLGRKGLVAGLFSIMKDVTNKERPIAGKLLNEIKQEISSVFNSQTGSSKSREKSYGESDYSLPGLTFPVGHVHPLQQTMDDIKSIFMNIGFSVAYGPEIDDDFHNFGGLNFPPEHPARDMQDTFFIEKDPDILLRTHTSSVQVRYMENNKPPIRTISPGRVYRNEAISARSHCFFHQIEGLCIDKDISFADLKQTLEYFTTMLFGKSKIRLRPSYFPFTEPSAEVDVYWGLENDVDYKMTKGTGWLEIMGCGMVDPNVLENCGIDPKEYSGYAFGLGIDRIALLLHQIDDIRLLSENDIRFIRQFKSTF